MSPARESGSPTASRAFRGLPRVVWALGFVSLLMDTSSELIHSLLPVFMASVLGASMTTIGLVEGVAEATAAITKVFSGAISDAVGKRKPLAVLGYGLAAATKPMFPLAPSIGWVFTARFLDRIGKGIRGAPRDALVAEVTPRELRGAAYGLRQALDSVGAFAGPVLALAFMMWLSNDIRKVLWVGVTPALLAVALLALGVREPERAAPGAGARPPLSFAQAGRLPLRFWLIVMLGAAFTLARFSEAFLVLRARDVGLALGRVPWVLIVMNVVFAAAAYPAGAAADRVSRRSLLVAGLGTLVAADVLLATASAPRAALIGAGLWGLHMGLTQGLFAKLVADTAPADLLGTAFGVFNLVSGVTLLLASALAGALWSALGAPAPFWAGAAFAALAAAGLIAYPRGPEGLARA
ncbi:MAG: MFS transporter [bacterium]